MRARRRGRVERTGARAGSSQPPRKDGALSAPPGVSCVSPTEPSCGAQAHGPARRRPGASALLLAWPDCGFDAHGACAADPQTPWPALGTRCLRTWRARPRHRPTMSPTQTWARRHHLCTLQALSPSVLPDPSSVVASAGVRPRVRLGLHFWGSLPRRS